MRCNMAKRREWAAKKTDQICKFLGQINYLVWAQYQKYLKAKSIGSPSGNSMTQASKDIKIQAHRAKENQDTDVHRAKKNCWEEDLERLQDIDRQSAKENWEEDLERFQDTDIHRAKESHWEQDLKRPQDTDILGINGLKTITENRIWREINLLRTRFGKASRYIHTQG